MCPICFKAMDEDLYCSDCNYAGRNKMKLSILFVFLIVFLASCAEVKPGLRAGDQVTINKPGAFYHTCTGIVERFNSTAGYKVFHANCQGTSYGVLPDDFKASELISRRSKYDY